MKPSLKVVGWGPFRLPGERKRWLRAYEWAVAAAGGRYRDRQGRVHCPTCHQVIAGPEDNGDSAWEPPEEVESDE